MRGPRARNACRARMQGVGGIRRGLPRGRPRFADGLEGGGIPFFTRRGQVVPDSIPPNPSITILLCIPPSRTLDIDPVRDEPMLDERSLGADARGGGAGFESFPLEIRFPE